MANDEHTTEFDKPSPEDQAKQEQTAPDDATVVHDQQEAKERAEQSTQQPVTEKDLVGKTNTEGVGQSEIKSSRERHQYVDTGFKD